jgi:PAS domain S-box-containing protein
MMEGDHQSRVLIVDDSLYDLRLLSQILMRQGYRVLQASDGKMALQIAEQAIPDLILLDIQMPEMDGYETCQQLKTSAALKNVPVIFVSGFSKTLDKVKAFQLGGVDYITKPFQEDELVARVYTHLRLTELTEHLETRVEQRTLELAAANRQLQQEIVERKRTEEKLREQEMVLSDILEVTLSGYWDLNVPANTEYLSPAFKKMFGYEDHELPNSPETWQKLIFPEDLPVALSSLDRHIKSHGQTPFCNELRYRHKNGSTVWVICAGRVIEWAEDGSPIRVVGCHVDITERMQVEEELRKYQERLEDLVSERTVALSVTNRELEAFSYSVSHDLRTPLRSMDGYSQMLLEDYGDRLDEEGKNYLRQIRGASQRMGELINDLMQLSRINQAEIHRELVDLSELVRSVAATLQQNQPERKVEFSIQSSVTGWGDKHLLVIVLENLLSNALKFTTHQSLGRIEFGTTRQGKKNIYFVRDNGVGFDMKSAEKLFSPFQRLHSDKDFPGTGVGLSTVRRIIQRHGGQIWAEAEVEKGATFYFTLAGREN